MRTARSATATDARTSRLDGETLVGIAPYETGFSGLWQHTLRLAHHSISSRARPNLWPAGRTQKASEGLSFTNRGEHLCRAPGPRAGTPGASRGRHGGRHWTRTRDLLHVKQVL